MAELDLFQGYIYTGVESLLSSAGPLDCAGAFGVLANVEPELSASAFAEAAAQRRLAAIERTALQQFPMGLKRLMRRHFGTSTTLERGRAAFLGGGKMSKGVIVASAGDVTGRARLRDAASGFAKRGVAGPLCETSPRWLASPQGS
jgi:hypothetical protein